MANQYMPWSEEEDNLIVSRWPTSASPAEMQRLLPHRTIRALGDRASRLGVRRNEPMRPWSEAEDNTIRELFPESQSTDELVEMLPGRSMRAIRDRALVLRVKRNKVAAKQAKFERSIWDDGESDLRKQIVRRAARGARSALKAMGAR
jgi:hypothetical protein